MHFLIMIGMMKLIKCFDKVIELDSKNVDAWNNRGYALTTVEKFEQAVNYYDKALEIYSRRFDSTTIHPSIAKIWNNRGNAYANLLKYDRSENGYNYTKAKESYKKAIENDAEFISAYNNDALLDIVEGNLFDKERFYQNAKATLDKLYSKLYSNKEYKNVDIETLDNYGVIYYHLEDYDKALDYFSKANEQDDKSKIIWYHLGRAQTKLKKYKQALRLL